MKMTPSKRMLRRLIECHHELIDEDFVVGIIIDILGIADIDDVDSSVIRKASRLVGFCGGGGTIEDDNGTIMRYSTFADTLTHAPQSPTDSSTSQ